MESFNALSRGSKVMLVAGALLLIDTFFAWQRVEVFDIEASQNAWNGFFGVLLGLLTVALVVWLLSMLAGREVRLPVSDAMLGAILAGIILLFALIKVLDDDFTTSWAYIGLALAAIVALGAWLNVQDAGGVQTLRSEASDLKGAAAPSTPAAATTPAPDPTPPPAPSPEPPPPAPAPEQPTPPPDDPDERS